ncbi:MAG: hypothetical protein LE168_04575 [Endomicrobium sp.]|nr:hypothetical protein [Endomicrobium sp.]
MGKTIVLLLGVIIFANLPVFSGEDSQPKSVKETVLEYPYKPARQDKAKHIDGAKIILKNVSSVYKKSHTIVRNLNNNKMIALLKKAYENTKNFIFKLGLLLKQQ